MSGHHFAETPAEEPPLVIACAYPEGMLASTWYRAYKRCKQTLKRGSYRARVELVPITALPSHVDVLVVPPSLQERAEATAGVGERLVTSPEALQGAFDRLVERLVSEGRLGHAPPQARALAVHRGFQALTERARQAE
jgi:hypothetical protein